MFSVVCHDPSPKASFSDPRDDFANEGEIGLQRTRWLDEYVGYGNWSYDLEWDIVRRAWTFHYRLDCPPSVATLFKLMFGNE